MHSIEKFDIFTIFLENYNLSMNITEQECIPLENLVFSVFFMKTVIFQLKTPNGSAFHWKI